MKRFLIIGLLLLAGPLAHAELAGKKVVYVHGFQIEALDSSTTSQELQAAAMVQAGPVLNTVIDAFLFYDSAERLSANSATLADQIRQFEQQELCRAGCFFITGSTGDLVTRYVISRLGQWGIDSSKFSILLAFDIVGAGGGTELADTAVGLVQGNSLTRAITEAISEAFLGITLNSGANLGIVNDLRPSVARNHATGNYAIPRLRIVGGQQTPVLSQLFIKGRDDGVVPLHSACGSARQESIHSCSRSIKIDGKLTSADGPRTLRYNHFPIIMNEDMKHREIDYKGKMVAVNNNRTFSHSTSGSTHFSVKEKTKTTGFWIFKSRFRTIDKPSNQLAVDFIIDEFN